jgi:S1-C subfamily serine protease
MAGRLTTVLGGFAPQVPPGRPIILTALLVALASHGLVLRVVRASRAGPPRPEEARAIDRVLPRAIDRIAPSLLRVHPKGDASEIARKTRTALALERDLAVMDALSVAVTGVEDLVVEDAAGKVHAVRVRGRDLRLRLVALAVDDGELVPAPRATRVPDAGAFVLALGTVYGTKPNAAFGIVSAPGRFEGRALQVDCGIDPANAGGAVCDLEGGLVGVPVLVDRKLGDDSGVGFVVPMSRIERVVERLKKGDELQTGFMGIALPQDEPEITPSLEGGVKIEGIRADGPAQKAGLETNDVILSLGGEKVSSLKGLLGLLSDHAAGDAVEVVVLRAGHEIRVTLTLTSR